MKEKVLKIIKESGIFLLMFLTIILLFSTVLWIFKVPITRWHLPIEFLLTIVVYSIYAFFRNERKITKSFISRVIITVILSALCFSVSSYIESDIYDTTSDGNTYHKLAIGSMKNGWIPLYESCKDYTREDGNVVTVSNQNINYLWADHYAIGTEILGANIYAFSNNIETGKAFNLVIMYCAFAITLEFFAKKKINIIFSIALALMIAVNPITATQWGTYYVDTTLAMTLFLIFIELLNISNESKDEKSNKLEYYSILGMSIAICINAKFTGLVYAAIFCFVFFVYWLIKSKSNKEELKKSAKLNVIFYIVTVIASVCIIGGSSYLMNTINYKHPCYPLYGEGHVDNMVIQEIPESLAAKSHGKQFLISIFSKGMNISPSYSDANVLPELKVPFTMTSDEIDNYIIPDIRMGGFGPLYSGIFILTCLGIVYIIIDLIRQKKIQSLIQYLLIIIPSAVMILALDGAYWARYIPYMYFITIMTFAYLFTKSSKIVKSIGAITIVLLLINSFVVVNVSTKSYIDGSKYVSNSLQNFKDYVDGRGVNEIEVKLNSFAFQGVEYNIDDLGIKVIENQDLEAERDGYFFSY